MAAQNGHVGWIWEIAELLRGRYKQSEYGRVALPLTVLRRFDCVLEPTKEKVLEAERNLPPGIAEDIRSMILAEAAGGLGFYNTSPLSLQTILKDSGNLSSNLIAYVAAFSPGVRDVFLDKFKIGDQIERLAASNLLFLVLERFAALDLHPGKVSNHDMGMIFEELIRRFAEISNETAGEHFTPREVIRLMVDLLFVSDEHRLAQPGAIRWIYDPACGTGGMLSVAEEHLREINAGITVKLFGQEVNAESFAICRSDMLIKGQEAENIAFGDTLAEDRHASRRFHYMLSNPPFGVDWRASERAVRAEHERAGAAGRFAAGLPRIGDGQLLFLQHMLSKMRDDGEGSRIAIVMNGSPLFTGSAGSGESQIRRWIIENDWLEALVALPTNLFYNTGIQTYIWVLSNKKYAARRGRVQLINASGARFWQPIRRSLGEKRRELSDEGRALIARIFADPFDDDGKHHDISRMMPNDHFGYRRITVEHPLRLRFAVDEEALSRLAQAKAVMRLSQEDQAGLLDTVREALDGQRWTDRKAFRSDLRRIVQAVSQLRLTPALVKAIEGALGVRDPEAAICLDGSGKPEPDPELRDYENVPLGADVHAWFAREVLPYRPDAWINEAVRDEQDGGIGKVGYEINVGRAFYRYQPPRPLESIDAELEALEAEIAALLRKVKA